MGRRVGTYPDVEIKILVCNALDVEADGGDGGHNFANLCSPLLE